MDCQHCVISYNKSAFMSGSYSAKMIEDHYSHVTPVSNADRILQQLQAGS
jgi:hypothetical protein